MTPSLRVAQAVVATSVSVALVGLSPATEAVATTDRPRANHCVSPGGEDLNQIFATDDAFVAPFCGTAHTGDYWRPIVRIAVAGSDSVFPVGYAPTRPGLVEDFLAKFESATYVVDAGTPRQRSYVFSSSELEFQTGSLPDGSWFVRWTPRIHPLPPGDHTVDQYANLSDAFWDGLGTDPLVNLIPAGESHAETVTFNVIRPPTS